jgi:hypothetical protein
MVSQFFSNLFYRHIYKFATYSIFKYFSNVIYNLANGKKKTQHTIIEREGILYYLLITPENHSLRPWRIRQIRTSH